VLHFLACFRQARITAGLTQMEVAKKLRQSYVAKCGAGKRRVDGAEVRN
jgi:hypothetical protein